MKFVFKRVTNTPRKTVSFAPRSANKLADAGIELVTVNGIECGSWRHMKKIDRPDLQYWTLDCALPDNETDFYVTQEKKKYKDAGYEILPVRNYESNF